MVIVYLTKPKNILLLLQYLIKYMICLETTPLRIHWMLAAMQPPKEKVEIYCII